MIEITWMILLVLLACALAAYTDFKTGFIYDWITYPLIIIGLVFQLLQQNWVVLGLALIVLGLGAVFYYAGKMGGGDIKLVLGVTLLVPFVEGVFFPVLLLLAATLLAVSFFSIALSYQYFQKKPDWVNENKSQLLKAGIYLVLVLAYGSVLLVTRLVSFSTTLVICVPLLLGVIYFGLEKGIRQHLFLTQVKLSELEEDEVIAFEELPASVQEKWNLGAKRVIEEKDWAKLKELGIKTVPVYRNLPRFGPFIFLGCLVIVFFPEILLPLFKIGGL